MGEEEEEEEKRNCICLLLDMNFECQICQVTAGDMSNSFVCTIKSSFVIHILHKKSYYCRIYLKKILKYLFS